MQPCSDMSTEEEEQQRITQQAKGNKNERCIEEREHGSGQLEISVGFGQYGNLGAKKRPPEPTTLTVDTPLFFR